MVVDVLFQMVEQKEASIVDMLEQSNSLLPHIVLASTLLALVHPPSFTWFTTRLLNITLNKLVCGKTSVISSEQWWGLMV